MSLSRWTGAALLLLFSLAHLAEAYTAEDYYKAGLNFYNQSDYSKAIPYLKAAVQMDPQHWQAHQVLGYSYFKMQDRSHALAEFDESLRIHPDNPPLRRFADNMRPTEEALPSILDPTAPPPASQVEPWQSPATTTTSPAAKPSSPSSFRKKNWLEIRLGAAFATLGDLSGAPAGFNNAYTGLNTSASNSNLGFVTSALGALPLDSENALGVEAAVGVFGGLLQVATGGGFGLISETIKPTMVGLEMKYLRLFPMGGESRLRGEIGAGLYGTSLSFYSQASGGGGSYTIDGAMMGYGFGGTIGVSMEFPLGRDIALGGYLRGRYATTSGIQGTFEDQFGNQLDLGLAQYQGYVSWGTKAYLDANTNGVKWAVIDYTGAEAGAFLCVSF